MNKPTNVVVFDAYRSSYNHTVKAVNSVISDATIYDHHNLEHVYDLKSDELYDFFDKSYMIITTRDFYSKNTDKLIAEATPEQRKKIILNSHNNSIWLGEINEAYGLNLTPEDFGGMSGLYKQNIKEKIAELHNVLSAQEIDNKHPKDQ